MLRAMKHILVELTQYNAALKKATDERNSLWEQKEVGAVDPTAGGDSVMEPAGAERHRREAREGE